MSVITVQNLTKSYQTQKKRSGLLGSLQDLVNPIYEDKRAVNNVSFSIDPGELVGFIGPNGAGKTTTLKTLSGLLYPTEGTVRVLGHDPWARENNFLKQISLVMGQKNQLWWDLPASESFALTRDIYEIPEALYQKNLKDLVEMLEIGKVLNIQVRKLSLGQRMKAELVAALLHDPKVLFLDEPTIGLDVTMQSAVRNFIKEYNQSHAGAIILTSHYMADVVELCKRIIIISEGSLLYDGPLSGIISQFSSHKLIEVILKDGRTKIFKVPRKKIAEKTSKILSTMEVVDINIKETPIEDIIRQVFAKK